MLTVFQRLLLHFIKPIYELFIGNLQRIFRIDLQPLLSLAFFP